jgi:4-hydroxy-tetrahydrodipicolinate synthase
MNVKDYPLWTALITPLNNNQTVDFDSLTSLIKEQESSGNGLLILGSTGEALNLTKEECKAVLEHSIKVATTSPIMVGVGGSQYEETSEWVKYLETLDVHAYLMVTPLYAKPGDEGQYAWFKGLMDQSTRPIMLYNVPSRTGMSLSFEACKRLNDHPMLWAIKEASGKVEDFVKYKESTPNAMIYSGDDALTPLFAKNGASGLVSVSANVWPAATNKYVELCLSNKLEEVALWEECSNSLFIASNPTPAKHLLHKLQRIKTPEMKLPLTKNDLKDGSILLESNERINNWLKNL